MEAFAWTIVVVLLLLALLLAAAISAVVALAVGDRYEDGPASETLPGGDADPPGPSSVAAGPSTDRARPT